MRPWCKRLAEYLSVAFIIFVSWRAADGDFGSTVLCAMLLLASHSYWWKVGKLGEQEKRSEDLIEKRYEDYVAREESARHVEN